jgi:hypothetical protein
LTGFLIFSNIDHGRRQQQQQLIKPITYLLTASLEILEGSNCWLAGWPQQTGDDGPHPLCVCHGFVQLLPDIDLLRSL